MSWLVLVTLAGFLLRLVWIRYATRVPVGSIASGGNHADGT